MEPEGPPTVVQETLFCTILLHLPLQVVWRFPGLNHILQKALMNEQVWFERNMREFPRAVGLNAIRCHRIYQLLRSYNYTGNMWYGGKQVREGVHGYRTLGEGVGTDNAIYLDRTGLRLLVPEVDGLRPAPNSADRLLIGEVRYMYKVIRAIPGREPYLIHLNNGSVRLCEFSPAGEVNDLTHHLGAEPLDQGARFQVLVMDQRISDVYDRRSGSRMDTQRASDVYNTMDTQRASDVYNTMDTQRVSDIYDRRSGSGVEVPGGYFVFKLSIGGKLYYNDGRRSTVIREGIVEYRVLKMVTTNMAVVNYTLILLTSLGEAELITVGELPPKRVNITSGNYINTRKTNSSSTVYLHRADGFLDSMVVPSGRSPSAVTEDMRTTPILSPIPVRDLFEVEDSVVAVGIDGRSFQLGDNTLSRHFPELRYFGLIEYTPLEPCICVKLYPRYQAW